MPVIGDPLWAVLTPPQLERFRALAGLGDSPLVADFSGWNKYVLLTGDRVFLFPRQRINVEWFEREVTVYRALETTGLPIVPRLRARWHDDTIYPFPFAEVSRLVGHHPTDPTTLFGQLGDAIAVWHSLVAPELPGARPPAHQDQPHLHWLRRALDPATSADAATEAAVRLDRPDRLAEWRAVLGAAAAHDRVLVHGDIHEDQLLVVDDQLTGILDWETARVDHPFWDFDLAEWGTGLWRRHRYQFSQFWSAGWRAYAQTRGLDGDPRPLETAFRLRQALYVQDNDRDPAIVGTVAEHLASA